MANSFSQIHIHAIFAVQGRQSLISGKWCDQLYKYISTVIQNNGHKMLQINGMPDHIHILFGMRPTESLSDLIKEVKQSSSRWINRNQMVAGRFSWQAGYGAFSHSKTDLPRLIEYIQNQEKHHGVVSFRQEYIELLKTHQMDFDERYIFQESE
jgi:REP element-mobilizing transposase RayT